ncbi:hypothetical protein MMC28_001280 [Mycoblastus sanguinarius]|nr:hypothetical protein [Mycoblastus sanguinarius]
MAVPRMSQLRPGIRVNMVLKADQQSGKLTTGQISEILTRGDHPRGIKVRLSNGQVGRVQSLSASQQDSASFTSTAQTVLRHAGGFATDNTYNESRPRGGRRGHGRLAPQDDYREDPTPYESRSLADYIQFPPLPGRNASTSDTATTDELSLQTQLENEFPKLDSALIAAILADYPDAVEARPVLTSLS